HCSHVVVVSKLHYCEQHSSVQAYRRTAISDLGHPSLIPEVETDVDLGQLMLQIIKCNVNIDSEKIRILLIVVDCS
ncbi:hypothetical protein A2U01_0081324, partial [Trifolium medium]|nr:hypothetical protein [Trifolium medium]